MEADLSRPVVERRVRAMGSDIHLIVVGHVDGSMRDVDVDVDVDVDALADAALARIEQLDARWSRFEPGSEVSRLNDNAGHLVTVSADTVLLVRRAIEAWRLTGGGFDPTVLGDVLRAGYDRSFEQLAQAGPAHTGSALFVGCTDIVVTDTTVALPANTGFDPGGIGKGLAADLVTAETMAAGAAGVCVNMGGDLRVAGESGATDGTAWTIAIEHPANTTPLALVGLTNGAVCTSTTLRRVWVIDGVRRHHLIDPATGEPSDSDLDLVSVVAGAAWQAEVLAKAALLRGSARAYDVLDAGVEALTVDNRGTVRATPGFAGFLGGVPLPTQVLLPTSEDEDR